VPTHAVKHRHRSLNPFLALLVTDRDSVRRRCRPSGPAGGAPRI